MTDVELIKSRTDIIDLISSYIQLNKAGVNYKGLCPFHNEKTPSFIVNPTLQRYKCFGCGKGGDAITFIQEMERLEFPEALKALAERAGVELKNEYQKANPEIEEEKQKIYKANLYAAKFYQYILKTHKLGEEARKYAQNRGLGAKEIDKFMFGYAPNSRTALKKFLLKKGFDPKDLERWSLLTLRDKELIDKFRFRLMQPIFDLSGNIVGFSGRYLGSYENAPKYLNSGETLVYKKQEILFSLYQSKEAIRKANLAILVEGNIDPVSSHRVGVENVVAPLGTSFTDAQGRLIKKFTDEIHFALDNDKAGIAATVRAMGVAENLGLRHKVIDVSPYQDADELIMKAPKEWGKRIKKPMETVDYLISKLEEEHDLGTVEGKQNFYKGVMPVLKLLKDEIQLSHFAKKIALKLEISEKVILEEIPEFKTKNLFETDDEKEVAKDEKPTKKNHFDLEKYFLAMLVQNKLEIKKNYLKLVGNDAIKHILESLLNDSKNIGDDDEHISEVYNEAHLFDLSGIDDINKELKLVIKRLKKRSLQSEILKIRRALLKNEDDESLLDKLNKLSAKLKEN